MSLSIPVYPIGKPAQDIGRLTWNRHNGSLIDAYHEAYGLELYCDGTILHESDAEYREVHREYLYLIDGLAGDELRSLCI